MTLEELAIERYAERHMIAHALAKEIFENERKRQKAERRKRV